MAPASTGRRVGRFAGHAARLGLVALTAWLLHAGAVRGAARQKAADPPLLPLDRVRVHLPEAVAIGPAASAVAGASSLVDATGSIVGTALVTSPAGDAAVGFSGPTNVLVVCDRDLTIAGMEILASRDTREHVRAVAADTRFWESFRGRALADLAAAPQRHVAGATLTSHAIAAAVALRLGASAPPGLFPGAPTAADLRQLFPAMVSSAQDPGDPHVIRIHGPDHLPLGFVLRTSPAADRTIGYQGPSDALVGFDTEGRVCGIALVASFDNEPYVGYVRDDGRFRRLWRGTAIEELAGRDPLGHGVEGVSGATMTSQAVAEGILHAIRAHAATRHERDAPGWRSIEGPQWGAIAVIGVGLATAFSRLRGGRFGRLVLPVVVLAYLGFGAGALVSLAQLAGWAQSGLPRGAPVLLVLTAVALAAPAFTGRNVYCSHLCAHGAAQQLLVRARRGRPALAVPPRLRPWLVALPWALLLVAVAAAALRLPVSLVDLEPFDAYLPTVAGVASLVIFAVGLAVSSRVPMAHCRHACPTGALLDQLRFHRRSDRITWRDGVLLACLLLAALGWWTA